MATNSPQLVRVQLGSEMLKQLCRKLDVISIQSQYFTTILKSHWKLKSLWFAFIQTGLPQRTKETDLDMMANSPDQTNRNGHGGQRGQPRFPRLVLKGTWSVSVQRLDWEQPSWVSSNGRGRRTPQYKGVATMRNTDFHVTSATNIRVTFHLFNHWEKRWAGELENFNINGSTSVQLSWLTNEVNS